MNTKTVYIYKNVDQNKQALIDAFNLALEEELHESPAEYVLVFQMLNWVSALSKPKTPRADKLIKEKSLAIGFAFHPKNPTKPIGLCAKMGKQFSLYVKPQFRRKGIGSALLELMRGHYGDAKCYAAEGIPESIPFFVKNRLSHHHHNGKKFSIFEHYRLRK